VLLLLVVLLLAWAAGAAYTLYFNVEMRLTRFMLDRKLAWMERRLPSTNRVIVFGGSSSSFSISPAFALEQGVPMVNLGMGAGIGSKVLTRMALAQVRAGDTLVMALEPDLLSADTAVTLIGAQSAVVLGHAGWANDSGDPDPNANGTLAPYVWALRPGGFHAVTMLGKVAQRRPLYRYQSEDFFEDGQQQTEVRGELGGFRGHPAPRLSADGKSWVRATRAYCERKGLKLVYALPWTLTEPASEAAVRRLHAAFLADLAQEVEILRDERLGCVTDRSWYCDTQFHMTLAGSRERTGAMVASLKAGLRWTESELRAMAATR
jgi:hypothetical protein